MIAESGFQAAFINFGIGQGLIIVIMAFFLVAPKPGQVPTVPANANIVQSRARLCARARCCASRSSG